MTFARSTSAYSCGTLGRDVVLRPAISGRLRASVRKVSRFDERNLRSIPARSSKTKVNPPEVPTPGMAGGEKEKATPSGSDDSCSLMCCLIAWSCSGGEVRSSHGFNVTKKKAL